MQTLPVVLFLSFFCHVIPIDGQPLTRGGYTLSESNIIFRFTFLFIFLTHSINMSNIKF
jgi:hypothetical protein